MNARKLSGIVTFSIISLLLSLTLVFAHEYCPAMVSEVEESENLIIRSIDVGFDQEYSFESGSEVPIAVAIYNPGDEEVDNVVLSLYLVDYGVWRKLGPFTVGPHSTVTKVTVMHMPWDMPNGLVDLRFVLSNDHIKRTTFRQVVIA